MNTVDFLKKVLPADGVYVSTMIPASGRPRQKYYGSLEELSEGLAAQNTEDGNVYYAMSAFVERGSRKQRNVRVTRSLFIDLDIGVSTKAADHKFATRKEALEKLAAFLSATGMPMPMIVDSGRGWHAYWPLSEELEPEVWGPLAHSLKTAAQSLGFNVDPSVTADSARVLRAVGTTNKKNGRDVSLRRDAGPFDHRDLERILLPHAGGQPLATAQRAPARQVAPVSRITAALSTTPQYPPAIAGVVINKCDQIRWAVDNPGEVSEPLWYAMLGVAAHCTEPEAAAIVWSGGHAGYTEDATIRKLRQWQANTTGPATCARFLEERPKGCDRCPLRGKIITPVQAGVQFETVSAPLAEVMDEVGNEVELPAPFVRTKHGCIAVRIDDTDIIVSDFDIYPVGYGRDDALGYEVVRYHWHRRHRGWQELKFRQAYLAVGSRELPTALADQGIVLPNQKQQEYFHIMLRSYMEELRKARTTTTLFTSLGWKEDNTQFLLGEQVFSLDGSGRAVSEKTALSVAVQRLGTSMYGTKGEREKWVAGTKVLGLAGLNAHMFALLVSMATPLLKFTGLKGAVLSLYGPTGSGKTLAQLGQQSVWGDPEELHFGSKYTQNALFNRIAFYNNLPMTVDETTMMADKDVGDFLYGVTQGKDKARLTRTSEEQEPRTWATTVTLSTNKPMAGKLLTTAMENEAQLARLLEIELPLSDHFREGTNTGRTMYKCFTRNYGHIGPELISRFLEMGEEQVRHEIAAHMRNFPGIYGAGSAFTGEERYYEGLVVLADYVGMKAEQWNMIGFNRRECIEYVLQQMGVIRRSISSTRADAFDVLSEYLNEHAPATVVVMHTIGMDPVPDMQRIPRGEIRARYDIYRSGTAAKFTSGTLLLDKVHFRKWLSSRGGDYRNFCDTIDHAGVDATPSSKKAMLGKNTPIKLPQSYVLGINLSHPRLKDVLNNAEEATDSMTLGQMRAVQ